MDRRNILDQECPVRDKMVPGDVITHAEGCRSLSVGIACQPECEPKMNQGGAPRETDVALLTMFTQKSSVGTALFKPVGREHRSTSVRGQLKIGEDQKFYQFNRFGGEFISRKVSFRTLYSAFSFCQLPEVDKRILERGGGSLKHTNESIFVVKI